MSTGLISGRAASGTILQPAIDAENRGDFNTAIKLYEEALADDDSSASAHNRVGALYYKKGDPNAAVRHFERAIQLRPEFPRALCNLGACHNEQGRNLRAIECYEKAITIDLSFADAYANMGKAWSDLNEFEMAVWCYRQSLRLRPSADSARGLAKNYRRTGRYHRARDILTEALKYVPDDPELHFNLALTQFHLGKYAEALHEYEWRFQLKDMKKHRRDLAVIFDRPAYQGQDLSDKTLLLHTEQGFGDNLQFARFVSLVRPLAGRLVMCCRPGLGALFSHSLPVDEVSEKLKPLPKFDYQLPLLSVPLHFDPHLKALKPFTAYLSAPPAARPLFNRDPERLNIGLVWGASDSGFDHRNKKVPLVNFDPLLHNKSVKWFSLQVGSDRDDLRTRGYEKTLVDVGVQLKTFAQTAQAIEALDLVISCDTSVAHLAGAMGKPVWVMLKKEPDWRWHPDGERSTWYPSARLYRQYSHGEWDDVIRRLIHDLDALLSGSKLTGPDTRSSV